MINQITYTQIKPLVQYVEVASDMVQCHFHCAVKSKKIVAITRLSKCDAHAEPKQDNAFSYLRCLTFFNLKKYFGRYEEAVEEGDLDEQTEKAVVHAFGKVSDRFIWSDEHKHFIYRF